VYQRLRELFPRDLASASGAVAASVSYAVIAITISEQEEASRYCITRNGIESFDGSSQEEVIRWLQQDIEKAVARGSRDRLFVHAGVVSWRGFAMLILGRSFTGKSTLVAELVRRGAVYYSDEFAILDEKGRVHPYGRPLVLRNSEREPSQDLRLVREDTMKEPLPIGLIVAAPYQAGTVWRPKVLRGTRAVLPLIDGTVLARQESAAILRIAARVAPSVVTLQGARSEATEVAPRLLDMIDDALVSQALGVTVKPSDGLAASLAAVAQLRLHSRTIRPTPPDRQLIAARYFRITDFFSPEDHRRVLDIVLAHENAFQESGIVGNDGGDLKDYGFRRSRTLSGAVLESIWDLFDRRLRGILPHVRRELGLSWFPPGEVERQVTAHGGGGFFAPHVDTGHPLVANRRISCVYHFHSTPRRFTGGELRLYDTWVTPHKTTAAPTYTTLTPLDNSVVFFPSDAFHEVRPVNRETEEFADSRFAVTIWFREGAWPAAIKGAQEGTVRMIHEDPTGNDR
jgi:2OG-Fe(II) oxygenase superfamily